MPYIVQREFEGRQLFLASADLAQPRDEWQWTPTKRLAYRFVWPQYAAQLADCVPGATMEAVEFRR